MKGKSLFILLLALWPIFLCKRVVVWIGIDGLPNRLINPQTAPFLFRYSRLGVHSSTGLLTSFVGDTFPALHTLATGLNVESHGIIANNMKFDGKIFDFSNTDSYWWNQNGNTVPIWYAAEMSGKKSAVLHWGGGNVPFNRIFPSFYYENYEDFSVEKLLGQILDTLKLDSYDLIMGYSHEIDTVGRNFGPTSNEFFNEIQRIDKEFENFVLQIFNRRLQDKVDLIVTSTYGQQDTFPNQTIYLEDLTSQPLEELESGAFGLYFTGGDHVLARRIATEINSRANRRCTAYARDDVPREYFYSKNVRIPELVIIAYDGWCIVKSRDSDRSRCDRRGINGYPNLRASSMYGFFFATGHGIPFRKDIEKVKSVDIYPLVCHLLEIENWCGAHNGSRILFETPKVIPSIYEYEIAILVIIPALIIAVTIVVLLFLIVPKLKKVELRIAIGNQEGLDTSQF